MAGALGVLGSVTAAIGRDVRDGVSIDYKEWARERWIE